MANVEALVSSFASRAKNGQLVTIITRSPERNEEGEPFVRVFDGVHRAAIAKAMGDKFIKCRLVSGNPYCG
jgi:hypothetical protein